MRYTSGTPGWVDLTTPDVPGCRSFYEGLFGWTSQDLPTPAGSDYTMFRLGDDVVAGMGPTPPQLVGMPAAWTTYVVVEELDPVMARAAAAGGSVVSPAMDVMDQGRMGLLADPTGAVIGVWQPKAHEGADVVNVPGSMAWNELQSRDLDAALPFYRQVFGWRWRQVTDAGYHAAELPDKPGGDKSVAGALPMPAAVAEGVPSFWFVYFGVVDCDEALGRAQQLGGSVTFPPMTVGAMRFAGIADPAGAQFAVSDFGQP